MANKRIQDLENVEEVLADDLIPVGENVKTKTMLVSQFKNWLKGFFCALDTDQTIEGIKTFNNVIRSNSVNSFNIKSSTITHNKPQTPPVNGTIGDISFKGSDSETSCGAVQLARLSNNAMNMLIYASQSINGVRKVSSLELGVDANGNYYALTTTPIDKSNGRDIATTAWVRNYSQGRPNYSSGIDITSTVQSQYRASYDVYVLVSVDKSADRSSTATININGQVFDVARSSGNRQFYNSCFFNIFLSKDDTLKIDPSGATIKVIAYRLKGDI